MPLNKYLAVCGVASRRKANEPILQGRVYVNRDCVRELGRMVDVEKDKVTFDGTKLRFPKRHQYILLNKPKGVLTAVDDDRGRKTVLDLVRSNKRIFPVGRLDLDTTGVLLLTDDGELAYRLMHPKFEIEKVYRAWVDGQINEHHIHKLEKGVAIDPGVIVRGETKRLKTKGNRSLIEIRVHEGKKRQIKRMLKAVGCPVQKLDRYSFAGLKTTGLELGAWRHLTHPEIEKLHRHTGLRKTSRSA